MTLGTKIYQLRTQAGLSQEELAEQTGVSRQSVSKWETDASVPELDKLIRLAKLFEITLDELVQDEPPQTEPEPEIDGMTDNNAEHQGFDTVLIPPENLSGSNVHESVTPCRIVGMILFAVSFIGIILSLVFSNDYTVFIVAALLYCLLCGLLCATVRKHVGIAIIGFTALYLISVLLFIKIRVAQPPVTTGEEKIVSVNSQEAYSIN